MRVLDVHLEMSSDSKNHFGFFVEAMSEPGLTIKFAVSLKFLPRLPGTVSNGLNARQSEILKKIPQKASRKSRKSVRCSFRNVKRFQRSFCFSS